MDLGRTIGPTVHELWVPGEPVAKQRPRFQSRRRGGTFTPEKTTNWEHEVRSAWEQAGLPRLEGSFLKVSAEFQRGGAWIWVEETEWPRAVGLRGDVDNYLKSILDGLQDKRNKQREVVEVGAMADDKVVTHIEGWFHG